MRDRAFNIFLMTIIGIPGIAILVIAGTRPMPLAEMLLTISIGLIGLFWALIKWLALKSIPAKTTNEAVPIKARNT